MQKKLILVLTIMLTGRAMTLAFIHRAGGDGPGDPPAAWLMPLLGDAIVGLSGIAVAYLIWKRQGLAVWATVVLWNSIAIWDAMSAYIIHLTVPWPEFFMVQLLGSSMFFAASAMHLVILVLVMREPLLSQLLTPVDHANATDK
jgi:hypothetical protein